MDLLEPREEEELFKTRLLNVEEKPFKRITKRLATLHRVVADSVRQEQTPPPEAGGVAGAGGVGGAGDENGGDADPATDAARRQAALQVLAQLREDATLDFAAFDASIARLRFLGAANAAERARYAADRGTIAATCDGVRADMVRLRAQLADARATLAVRRGFDALADRITQSRTLLPRPDQQATIAKLEDECRQLQAESAAYAATWGERKEQFARIMDESMRLRRLIRDEKEEVERRAGMDEDEDGPVVAAAVGRPSAAPSGTPGTPGGGGGGGGAQHTPLAAAAAAQDDGSATPQPGGEDSATTPQPGSAPPDADGNGGSGGGGGENSNDTSSDGLLKPHPEPAATANAFSRAGSARPGSSRGASRAASREGTPAATPAVEPADEPLEEADDTDVDMVEVVGMPQSVDEETSPREAAEDDTMDTT